MIDIGIVGFGSMGRMLAEGLLRNESIRADRLFIYTRTKERTAGFKQANGRVTILDDIEALVDHCSYLFICVPPLEVKNVLLQIKDRLTDEHVLISFAGYVTLSNMGSIVSGPIIKIIPSFTSEVDEGVFLTCCNDRVTERVKQDIAALLSALGTTSVIDESQFEVYSDITSCSPGIFSSIFEEFIASALRHGDIDLEETNRIFVQTLYGIAKLYKEKNLSFSETIRRVARKGGITEEGIAVVRDRLPHVFDEIFERTLAKHARRKTEMQDLFREAR